MLYLAIIRSGIESEGVRRNATNSGHDGAKIRCPCVNCLNGRILDVNIMREHLLCDGFLRS